MQIGHRGKSKGSLDTGNFNNAADIYVSPKTNEVFVADGYVNRRVIVLDADTGAFKRMWGAFGNRPEDVKPQPPAPGAPPKPLTATEEEKPPPPAPGAARKPLEVTGPGPQQFAGPVHAVRVSNDGLVYVGDRANRR